MRERLLEEREIGERGHRFDARLGELRAGRVEIELAFQVVHAGFQKRLAVQLAPQADRAELLALRQRLVGKVAGHFFGRQVDVGKDHDAAIGLLEHLRTPTRLATGVKPLAADEAHLFERGDEWRKAARLDRYV